jgi:hypothetical protein
MEELSPAQKMYQQHLRNVSNYQKRNAEKMREKQRKRLEVIKQDPEKYEELRKKRKEYNESRKKVKEEVRPEPPAVDVCVGVTISMLEPQIPPVTPPIPRLRGRHLRHQSAQN